MSTSPYVKCFAFIVNAEEKPNLNLSTSLFLSPGLPSCNKYKYLLCYIKTVHGNCKIQTLHASKLEKNGYSADITVLQLYPFTHRHSFARTRPSLLGTASTRREQTPIFSAYTGVAGRALPTPQPSKAKSKF